MKIYFAGSISGGRGDAKLYQKIIDHLNKYGEVLTEHVGDPNMSAEGESLPAKEIHDRDIEWLFSADLLVAEVTIPSLGVGYEIGRAVEKGMNILCLGRPSDRDISEMISGSEGVHMIIYNELEEAYAAIDEFVAKI